ncbi:LysR family transcriptional regulator [Aliiroseovarius sp. YM-037]|uniref:LysR family transcriptional regulator n=1 Tax=Aliiroseovarius sp. YM-037 TaxID=3341728 RepID=UPI003A7FEA49
MNETKFDWDDLRLFLAVARAGGLASATASTGKSAPTLGRRMLALERRLGRELFRRLPRGYELTDDGHSLLSKATALEQDVQPIIASGSSQAVPLVKVSAGLWVTHRLCTKVAEIIGPDPVRLRFIADDEVADIGRREALIGIRNRRPTGAGLAGRRVARVHFATYARNERVETYVQVVGSTPSAKWVRSVADGKNTIEVTNSRNALDLALTGAARAVLPTFIGDRFSELKQISPIVEELEHDQWLVTHHEDRFLPEVRRVIDRIYTILRAQTQGS